MDEATGAGRLFEGARVTLARHADAIAVMTLTNPQRGLMDGQTETELEQALDALGVHADLRVVVVTGGQPGVFVRHFDVATIEQRSRKLAARGLTFSTERPVPESPVHRVMRRIESNPRIFIAAINGHAMGGGFELALACDLRIAQDGDYRIGLPETNIGLLPGAGGTQRMARLVGSARALEWILFGRTFVPREAAANGLVHECCDGDVLARALERAADLAARHPAAIAHVKRLVRTSSAGDAENGFADERTLFCDLMVSQRTIDDLAAFNAGGREIWERGG